MPNYLISWSTNKVILRNYEGVITTYTMPLISSDHECHLKCDECDYELDLEGQDQDDYNAIGIAKLLSDYEEDYTLIPENLERDKRNNGDDNNEG